VLIDRLRAAAQPPAEISRRFSRLRGCRGGSDGPAIVTGQVLLTIGVGLMLLHPSLPAVRPMPWPGWQSGR
jgi:hypothetical protein